VTGAPSIPVPMSGPVSPMTETEAEAFFKGARISGEGMADGRQQREKLLWAAVLHRSAAQQPDRTETWVPGQT